MPSLISIWCTVSDTPINLWTEHFSNLLLQLSHVLTFSWAFNQSQLMLFSVLSWTWMCWPRSSVALILSIAPMGRLIHVGIKVKYRVRPGSLASMQWWVMESASCRCMFTALYEAVKSRFIVPWADYESSLELQSPRAITQQQQLSVWLRLWELAALFTHNTNLEESNGRQGIGKSARQGSFREHELICLFIFLWAACLSSRMYPEYRIQVLDIICVTRSSTLLLLLSGLDLVTSSHDVQPF